MHARGAITASGSGGARLDRLPPIALAAALAIALLATSAPARAASWADPAKTLRTAFEIDVTGFDPAATQDLYSNTIESRIFDALYEWDYLARPYRYVPSVAAAMPEYSADGKTWTIRIKPGIHFSDDPALSTGRSAS